MTSPAWSRMRIGVLLHAGALVCLVGVAMAFGPSGRALAQGGAPGPGWVQTPGGEWVPPGHSLGSCHLHTLSGTYIFAASGYNIVGGVAVPKAIVEAIRFNGDGTLTVPAVTVSINGIISSPPPGGFDLFLGPAGTEKWMIQTNPDTVFQGTVTRVSTLRR